MAERPLVARLDSGCQNNQKFALSKQNHAALKPSEINETPDSKICIYRQILAVF